MSGIPTEPVVLPVISLVVSIFALGASVLTAWLTLLRRGRILMTQPTVIYFGPDGGSAPGDLTRT
jgi:hypothetical protein